MGPFEDINTKTLFCACGKPGVAWIYHRHRIRERVCVACSSNHGFPSSIEAPFIYKPHSAKARTFDAQKGVCHYCGNQISFNRWTIDHVVPKCRGGRATYKGKTNIIGCCRSCNNAKGDMPYEAFMVSPWLSNTKSHTFQAVTK